MEGEGGWRRGGGRRGIRRQKSFDPEKLRSSESSDSFESSESSQILMHLLRQRIQIRIALTIEIHGP
jgi:hypothetical protein